MATEIQALCAKENRKALQALGYACTAIEVRGGLLAFEYTPHSGRRLRRTFDARGNLGIVVLTK